jgi:hypothetical protein
VADRKNQHYVPKCHFKPFTVDREGRGVHVFNFSAQKAIPNAPVKGQCAKDYFHGSDLWLENALSHVETHYGVVVHPLSAEVIKQIDLPFLADYTYLQYHRTDVAVRRKRLAEIDMQDALFTGTSQEPPEVDLSDQALIHESIDAFKAMRPLLADLKSCLIKNQTTRDFVTSDDPAVLTNRFYIQRLDRTDFGIASSGIMLVLPLTPRYAFLAYDGGAYMIPEKKEGVVEINDVRDVYALNELQYLKAAQNVYFSNWSERDLIASEFKAVASRRTEKWNVVNMAVPVDGDPTLYRQVSWEKAREARRSLLHLQVNFPRPTTWVSKIKHRTPPRTYTNGTGTGHVRKREFLNGW